MRFSLSDQLRHELRSVLQGYPDFVFSNHQREIAGHVPVFLYHTVRPAAFEQDLQFLAQNGYQTWGMTELVRCLGNEGSRPENVVVLTFDDARSSFWRFAFPLLERYDGKGVLFVNPGLTVDAPAVRPTLSSVWSGEHGLEEIERLDPDDTTLCTWPEVQAMYRSGRVEVESHSLFHQEVFVGTELRDFLLPDGEYAPFDTPATAYLSPSEIGQGIRPDRFFGLPVFPTAPLHQGLPFWEIPDGVKDEAREIWREVRAPMPAASRRGLFARWAGFDWTRTMRRRTIAEVERTITEDIAIARDLLKDRIDPAAGDHFCLPYTVGSQLSLQAMGRLGIRSCSWGVLPGKRYNSPGDSPLHICRIKADFIRRLPGAGRKSLLGVYSGKLMRRLRRERVF